MRGGGAMPFEGEVLFFIPFKMCTMCAADCFFRYCLGTSVEKNPMQCVEISINFPNTCTRLEANPSF